MRTFEEAINIVVASYRDGDDPEVIARAKQQSLDMRSRTAGLQSEIRAHPRAATLVKGLEQSVKSGLFTTEEAIGTALMNGILIGIWMEKAE